MSKVCEIIFVMGSKGSNMAGQIVSVLVMEISLLCLVVNLDQQQ
jgi:hypothetical protein